MPTINTWNVSGINGCVRIKSQINSAGLSLINPGPVDIQYKTTGGWIRLTVGSTVSIASDIVVRVFNGGGCGNYPAHVKIGRERYLRFLCRHSVTSRRVA